MEVLIHESEEVVSSHFDLSQHQSLLGCCRLNPDPLRLPEEGVSCPDRCRLDFGLGTRLPILEGREGADLGDKG